MPKASEVAAELRKLADALDKNPDAPTVKPYIQFSHKYMGADAKNMFVSLVRSLPKPLSKMETCYPGDDTYQMKYEGDSLDVYTSIEKSKTCVLVEPAKPAVYRCDPILSEDDEAELEASHV